MGRLITLLGLVLVVLMCGSQCLAQPNADAAHKPGVVLSDVPRKVDADALYLIYLSGFIVEAGNTRPTSPQFGVYEYEQILETFRLGGFVVISEARKQSHEIEPYAKKVAGRVRRLLDAGVPPRNITIVGASQGAWIGMLASTYLKNRGLNFVFIGSCGADEGFLQLVDLHGHVLFISERTDRTPATRCQLFRDDATGLGEYKVVETNTGQRHGFLYRPLKEWVEPTIAWARRPNNGMHPTRITVDVVRQLENLIRCVRAGDAVRYAAVWQTGAGLRGARAAGDVSRLVRVSAGVGRRITSACTRPRTRELLCKIRGPRGG